MSRYRLIGVPFHLGARGVGMGKGPHALLGQGGVPDRLRAEERDLEMVELGDPAGDHEVGRVFELNRALADAVAEAIGEGRMPLTLGGNCNVCLGTLGGIDSPRTGIVWFDAHPDFHTPQTTETGFLDGVGLAAATGACWTALCRSIAGFHAVEERNTVLVGARDVDPGEKERLDSSEVTVIPGGGGPGTLAVDDVRRAVTEVADRVDGVYLHIDFDAIDPSLGRANEYAVEGGLAVEDVRDAVSAIADLTAIRAASFTAFDPDLDPDFHATAIEVVASVLDASAAGDASVA